MTRLLPAAVAALSALLAAPAAAKAQVEPLDTAIRAKAPLILDHLQQKKGFKNVGVLKFLVQRPGEPARDDVGDLNMTLANKTETALILALPPKSKFGVLDKASDFVAQEKLAGATHLTADGRRAFFTRKYPLAWTNDKVDPDGFLTGVAVISDDRRRVTVRFQAFDKSGEMEDLAGDVTVPTDPEMLAQAGHSYTRKVLVAGDPPPRQQQQDEAVKNMRVSHPPKSGDPKAAEPFQPLVDCPVRWTVLYNNKPVPVVAGTLPEPGPDDKVSFHLHNPGPGTFAAVLLVNGQNTLYQERQAPRACRKWVLTPQAEVTVRGFQVTAEKYNEFVVLRPDQPVPDEVRYGDHAGTFRLVVYQGRTSTTPPENLSAALPPDEAAGRAVAQTRGSTRPVDARKKQTLEALQADLRGRAKQSDGARGYVVKSEKVETLETEATYFVPTAEEPVADISLQYVPRTP